MIITAPNDLRPRFKIEISHQLMMYPMPKWLQLWGIAWTPYDRCTHVLLPLPLNYVVGWARATWQRLQGGYADKIADAYEKGRAAGFRAGVESHHNNAKRNLVWWLEGGAN